MTRRLLGSLLLLLTFALPAFPANVFYNAGKAEMFRSDIDGATLKVILVMTNTTVDTENDAVDTVAEFTTLDEFDGTGYTAGGITLTTLSVEVDATNDRAELHADDVSSLTLGDGTRQIAGFLVIKFNTTTGDSIPLAFYDRTASPINGSDLSGITWNAEGLLQL